MIPFLDLFRFAHTKDVVLMVLGIICASALGASYPLFSFLWGDMIDSLALVDADIIGESRKLLIRFIYLGVGACIVGWGMFTSWRIAGSRQASECKKYYLQQLMKQ
jgi:ATP-binding cassette subfamily B (MDR/TAP) protein 1